MNCMCPSYCVCASFRQPNILGFSPRPLTSLALLSAKAGKKNPLLHNKFKMLDHIHCFCILPDSLNIRSYIYDEIKVSPDEGGKHSSYSILDGCWSVNPVLTVEINVFHIETLSASLTTCTDVFRISTDWNICNVFNIKTPSNNAKLCCQMDLSFLWQLFQYLQKNFSPLTLLFFNTDFAYN